MSDGTMNLYLRMFADCPNIEEAALLRMKLLTALSNLSPQEVYPPRPYWKEPHLFEFVYTLSPANEASFKSVISLTSNWVQRTGKRAQSAVWNRTHGELFLIPQISWVSIELYYTATQI